MALSVYLYAGCDWVVAESIEDAKAVWTETTGDPPEDDEDWVAEPDDKLLTISDEDGDGEPTERKTCAEWAKARGRCFLASTEY